MLDCKLQSKMTPLCRFFFLSLSLLMQSHYIPHVAYLTGIPTRPLLLPAHPPNRHLSNKLPGLRSTYTLELEKKK